MAKAKVPQKINAAPSLFDLDTIETANVVHTVIHKEREKVDRSKKKYYGINEDYADNGCITLLHNKLI